MYNCGIQETLYRCGSYAPLTALELAPRPVNCAAVSFMQILHNYLGHCYLSKKTQPLHRIPQFIPPVILKF